MAKKQHTQALNGLHQINMTVAFLLSHKISFGAEFITTDPVHRWEITVDEEHKGVVQRFATIAGDALQAGTDGD